MDMSGSEQYQEALFIMISSYFVIATYGLLSLTAYWLTRRDGARSQSLSRAHFFPASVEKELFKESSFHRLPYPNRPLFILRNALHFIEDDLCLDYIPPLYLRRESQTL